MCRESYLEPGQLAGFSTHTVGLNHRGNEFINIIYECKKKSNHKTIMIYCMNIRLGESLNRI
jgi:hypothetical protein